jgi:hypothetical protein
MRTKTRQRQLGGQTAVLGDSDDAANSGAAAFAAAPDNAYGVTDSTNGSLVPPNRDQPAALHLTLP